MEPEHLDDLGPIPVYHDADFPHGLRCDGCGLLFEEGQPIAERVDKPIGDMPSSVLVCVSCWIDCPVVAYDDD